MCPSTKTNAVYAVQYGTVLRCASAFGASKEVPDCAMCEQDVHRLGLTENMLLTYFLIAMTCLRVLHLSCGFYVDASVAFQSGSVCRATESNIPEHPR